MPAIRSGNQVYVSGQLPFVDGKLAELTGKVGAEVSPGGRQELAAICALNALAAIDRSSGLDEVVRDREGRWVCGLGVRVLPASRR